MVDGGGQVAGGDPAERLAPAGSFTVGQEHLAGLFTHVDAVVFAFDASGVITFITNGVGALLGYEPAELVGRSAFDFVHPDDAVDLVATLGRWVGRDGATRAHDLRVHTIWGTWIDVAFETVTGASIAPFGAGVATIRPVRETTSVEQELRQRLVNEDRITRLVRTFMGDDGDFDACVRHALELIGSLEGVDAVSIWRAKGGWMHHEYQWTAPTTSGCPQGARSFRLDRDDFGRSLLRLEEVALRAVSGCAEPGLGVGHVAPPGTHCLLAAPMVTDGLLAGFVSFTSMRDENIFAPTHRSTARAAAGILAEAFARHEVQARLEHQARTDSLTGLANRWAFGAAVEHALATRGTDASSGVAILLFDLDRFHVVNDTLGHPVGDALLVAVADRLQQSTTEGELLARLGGDELVVLLSNADESTALRRAEQLLTELDDPFRVGPSELRITASVGVSCSTDLHSDRSELLREADVAMYAAKREGGHRARVFGSTLRDEVSTRLQREHDLHGAVDRGEFVLHYQPEFALASGCVVGMEALLRWQHPHCGLLAPGEFIEIAEDSGLIVDIGAWVMEAAFRQLRAWIDSEMSALVMRVNLSARQVARSDLVLETVSLARRVGIDPRQVCFEITETAMMVDPASSIEIVNGLHDAGFTVAIDDFGTGYSSLAYLRSFPVDLLKIDRSFVSRLGETEPDTALVRAIIAMAATLGIPVTAEGIETEAQRNLLVELGCPHGQGYLMARPAPPDELVALITEAPTCVGQPRNARL
jgi:diguanylate cyclase (GGDEF)-like protein/PAS domain S-box-containing protein